MKILLKGAQVVFPDKVEIKDILIEAGKISKIAENINVSADNEYVLEDKFILPGIIDPHVHFRTPGYEYKEDWVTATKAALAGGVTTVFDMPNTKPHTTTLEALNQKRDIVRTKSLINYKFFFGATLDNLEEIEKIENDPDVVGLKLYMATSTGDLILEHWAKLEALMENLFSENKFIVAVHAEDETLIVENSQAYSGDNTPEVHSLIRNNEVAYNASKKAVHMAKKYNGRVHLCHISTHEEVQLMMKYPEPNITCEATPHHLFFTIDEYAKQGNKVKVNPPIRSEHDRKVLWDGIKSKAIDMIATDHAPHLIEEKTGDYKDVPSGVPGVETMLPLMLNAVNNGELSISDIVMLMSANPARIFNIENKGEIKEGFDADITIVEGV